MIHQSTPGEADHTTATLEEAAHGCALWSLYILIPEGVSSSFPRLPFACVDDKHQVKVGETSCPVAAAERGRQVLVRSGTSFEVSDHDFTHFSSIQSVSLIIDVPDAAISESSYEGDVHVM